MEVAFCEKIRVLLRKIFTYAFYSNLNLAETPMNLSPKTRARGGIFFTHNERPAHALSVLLVLVLPRSFGVQIPSILARMLVA